MESDIGETMIEIRKVAKGINVVEGKIFTLKHRKDEDFRKFIENI